MDRLPQEIFQSLDHAKTKEFILAHTVALSSRSFLAKSDVKIIQTLMTRTENEPFLALFEKNPALVNYFEKIWSGERLFINHFKFSTVRTLVDFTAALKDFVLQLQKKSELFFNQYFQFKAADGQHSKQLMSEFLTEFAERCATHLQTFTELTKILNTFEKSSLSNHDRDFCALEIELVASLEMTAADKSLFSSNKNLVKKIAHAFHEMTSDIKSAFACFSHGLKDIKKSADLGIKLSWCQAEISVLQQIFSLSDEPRDFRVREIQRIEASFNIYSATEFLKRTLTQFIVSLSQSNVYVVKNTVLTNEEIFVAWLATKIVADGLNSENAIAGVDALWRYCKKNDSIITQLLPDEFKKIHPSLSAETHSQACTFVSEDFGKISEGVLKKKLLARAFAITKSVMVVFVFILASCGLKTAVHSSEKDLRPELPFRTLKRPPETSKKPAETIEKNNDFQK